MPRFIAVVELSQKAIDDLAGSRQREDLVRRYLARRGVRLDLTFRLDGTHHLFVLEATASPTRLLNRALARAWPEPTQRPGLARLVSADHVSGAVRFRCQPRGDAPPADRGTRVATY
jgi:hypothetical protein